MASNIADEATKRYFLSLKSEDIGVKKLTELFGWRSVKDPTTGKPKFIESKYKQNMRMTLHPGEYINEKEVQTNLGIFIFNKILIEPYISSIIPNGYYNEVLDKKGRGKLFNIISHAIEYRKIAPEQTWPFLKAYEFYTTKGVTIFSPSYTKRIIMPNSQYIKEKNEFFKDNPNPTTAQVVEFEENMIKRAKSDLNDDAGMPLYASGARGSFDDSYKNISFMIGSVMNPENDSWDVIKSNFVDGFSKEDLPKAGNMVINAAYPKSVQTAESGYITKQFNAVFQSIVVDEDGTDCKTSSYITVNITPENWKMYEFQNIITSNGIVPLTTDNKDKFINKTVKMRSPMCCTADKCCSVCAGRRPYVLDMPYIGLQLNTMPNKLLEMNMKKFHVTKVEINTIEPSKLLL